MHIHVVVTFIPIKLRGNSAQHRLTGPYQHEATAVLTWFLYSPYRRILSFCAQLLLQTSWQTQVGTGTLTRTTCAVRMVFGVSKRICMRTSGRAYTAVLLQQANLKLHKTVLEVCLFSSKCKGLLQACSNLQGFCMCLLMRMCISSHPRADHDHWST